MIMEYNITIIHKIKSRFPIGFFAAKKVENEDL